MPALQNEGYLTWHDCQNVSHTGMHYYIGMTMEGIGGTEREKEKVTQFSLLISLERTIMRCCDNVVGSWPTDC